MKSSVVIPKWFIVGATVALWMLSGAAVSAQSQAQKARIGVYDSRAVAVAYANSAEWREALKATRADYERAKTAKDDKKVKEIGSRMKLQQLRLHEQGFSTGSVAAIIVKVKGALPGIAQKAGVPVIVSKWELSYQSPELELVDVTDELVALFNVSDKGKAWAKDIRTKPPVPMEEITEDMD